MTDYSELKLLAECAVGFTDVSLAPDVVLELIAENEALKRQISVDEKKLDALLNHCEDGECHVCSQIICPKGDAFHFHHDGCPSCAQDEPE